MGNAAIEKRGSTALLCVKCGTPAESLRACGGCGSLDGYEPAETGPPSGLSPLAELVHAAASVAPRPFNREHHAACEEVAELRRYLNAIEVAVMSYEIHRPGDAAQRARAGIEKVRRVYLRAEAGRLGRSS